MGDTGEEDNDGDSIGTLAAPRRSKNEKPSGGDSLSLAHKESGNSGNSVTSNGEGSNYGDHDKGVVDWGKKKPIASEIRGQIWKEIMWEWHEIRGRE